MNTRRRPTRPSLQLKPGDLVLVGSRGCMPWQWWMATVLWAQGGDVLTEHSPPSGGRQRQILAIEDLRAVGAHAALAAFKENCAREVKALSDRVGELEVEMGRARDAVWAKVDDIRAAAWHDASAYAAELEPITDAIEAGEQVIHGLEAKRGAVVRRRRERVGT